MVSILQGHQYETVSGFICEAFGYIPRTGETIKVELEKASREEREEYTEAESDRKVEKETHQIFKLEVWLFSFPTCSSLAVCSPEVLVYYPFGF